MLVELLSILFLASCQDVSQPAALPPSPALAEPAPVPVASPYASVRAPAVAGSWYPGDAKELRVLLDEMAAGAEPGDCNHLPLALVLPHAGYRFSGPTAAKGAEQVRDCSIRRVWVLGPSHHLSVRGAGLIEADAWRTPLGDLPVDRKVMERLATQPGFVRVNDDKGEHSLEMELPLLQRALGTFELVPLQVGQIDLADASAIAAAIRPELGPGDLVVVSSDFTHYGPNYDYVPFTQDVPRRVDEIDHGAFRFLEAPNAAGFAEYISRTNATICGNNPLTILASLLDLEARTTEIAYTTSGVLTGDWSNSVSYLAARVDGNAWSGEGPQAGSARLVSEEAGVALRELAVRALNRWYKEGKPLSVEVAALPPGADTVLGAFVTLTKHGELRGCIGEIEPRRPVWQAVVEHAIDAAIHDPRFPPLTADELDEIAVEVSLLGPSRNIPSSSDIVLGRHGIVFSLGGLRATFLPQVAPEQGWDRAQTLSALARKAGIDAASIPSARIEVYEAQVIAPPGSH